MNSSIFKYIIRPTLGLLGFVLCIVILLHTSWGLNLVAQSVLSRLDIFDNASLSVGNVKGSPFSRLTLEDIILVDSDSTTLVAIENAQVGYRLFPMLKGEFHFLDVLISKPHVKMAQRQDMSWDLLNVIKPNTEAPSDSSSLVLSLDRIHISDGDIEASSYSTGGDSTYRIADLTLLVSNLAVNEDVSGGLDKLSGQLWIPQADYPVNLAVVAAYDGQTIQLDSLSLRSEKSYVDGKGRLLLSTADSLLYKNELSLTAAPLAFDDIRLFVPSLAPGHFADIALTIDSADENLVAQAAIDISDGARLSFQSAWTKSASGFGLIDAAGKLTNFDPGIAAGEADFDGLINADIKANLSGRSLAQLNGTGTIDIYNSIINGHELDSSFVQTTFDEGEARITIESGINGSGLFVTGLMTPFAEAPGYNLDGRLVGFDVDPFLGSDFVTNLNANINLKGHGFSLEEMQSIAEIQMQSSDINQFKINHGRLSAQIDQQQLSHLMALNGPTGSVQANGSVRFTQVTDIEALNLVLQDFDFMAVLGDTVHSAITGTTRINGEIDASGKIEASLQTNFDQVLFSQYDLRDAEITGNWKQDKITLKSSGAFDAGVFNVEGNIRLDEPKIAYEITEGDFERINIGSFLVDSAQKSDLNGSFFLVGSGADPASMSLSGQVELSPSKINQQQISVATTWFALQSDTLNFDVNVEMPEGTSALVGHVSSFTNVPSYKVTEGTLSRLDIGRLAGIEDLSTEINGDFFLTGTGLDPATMSARADIILAPSSVNQVGIQEGKTTATLGNNEGAIFSDITFEKGRFALASSVASLDNNPSFSFESTLEGVDVVRLMGSDSTSSEVNLTIFGQGEGLDPQSMTLESRLLALGSTYEDIRLDSLSIDFSLDEGLLVVDTLSAVSNVVRTAGSGPIAIFSETAADETAADETTANENAANENAANENTANETGRTSAFSLTTQILDLSPLEELLDVGSLRADTGELNTRIFGRQDAMRIDTRASGSGFVYNTFHLGELDVRVTGEFDANRAFHHADITGQISAVSIPGFVFEEINLEATYDSTEIRFASNGRLDRERGARVSGSFSFTPDGQRLGIDLVNLNLDEDLWELEQPATITIGSDYRIDNFMVKSGDQHIALDGVIDLKGEQDMQLDIKNFGVGTVADLLGFTGLDGPLTSNIDLQGPADAPTIRGMLDMKLISFDKEVGDLSINVAYDSLELVLDAALTQRSVEAARMRGVLPVDLSLTTPEASTTGAGISQNVAMDGGVDFSIDADSMAIDWVLPFIDPTLLNRLEGALTAHIKVGGTAKDPTLEGAGRLVDGKIRSPLLGVTYEDVVSDISLRDNTIELTNARVKSGEGFVSGNGSIVLSDLTSAILNIDVTASEFLAISTREYRATASGDMDLTGTLTSPVLNGDVTVLSADLFINESSASGLADLGVQLTQADLLMLEREFGIRATASDTTTFDFLDALSMDMKILFERDVWIRSKKNPEMNIQFSGALDVSKDPFEEYNAFGNIELIPDRSYINQFGKRFDITLGNLTFNGPATDPQLDFEALYEVPARRSQENAVTIYMDAKGKLEDLDLTLRAEPTMELTDILSYIATGQPASEALQLGGSNSQSLAGASAGFAINQGVGLLTGAIENLIQDSGLDLDVIQIEPLANAKGATITAGKYVTPRIFTSVSQPIGAADSDGTSTREEGTVITLELELIDSLLLRLLGGESVLQINLLWHHSY